MREEPCGLLIKQISEALDKNINKALKEDGLTHSQLMLMIFLSEAEEKKLPFKELEKKLGVAQPTVVGIISRLEQKGFVSTMGDASDKRVKLVELTDSGMEKCRHTHEFATRAEEKMLSGITDKEKNQLNDLLKKVRNNLAEIR